MKVRSWELVRTKCGSDPFEDPVNHLLDPAKVTRYRRRKRLYESVIVLLSLPVWIIVLTGCGILLLVSNGLPVLYTSSRRVYRDRATRILKFRTMTRDAESSFNRATITIDAQRFLNIPLDSAAFSRSGRMVERCNLTEFPQFLQVLAGQMSLVGNRPLPEDVVEALRETCAGVEARFWVRSGVIGPVQMVGRDLLSDAQRLEIEIDYSRICLERTAFFLDFRVLVEGVLIAAKIRKAKEFSDVKRLLQSYHVDS